MVCRPPKPVSVRNHTSSGAAVKTHCRGTRGGRAAPAKRVGQTKGALSAAVLKGIGKKAPAKRKAPAKKAPAKKDLIMSFGQGGRITDAEGKTVKRKIRADKGAKKAGKKDLIMSFGQGGRITDGKGKVVKRKDRADKGKKKAPAKKKAPPVPPRPAGRPGAKSYASVAGSKTRVGQTKGKLSGAVAGSLAAARRKKLAQSNPTAGYA